MIWFLLASVGWVSKNVDCGERVSEVRRTDIADEDEGVVLLHLLHGALSVERVDDDLVLIETGLASNGVTGVLGLTSSDQGCSSVSL